MQIAQAFTSRKRDLGVLDDHDIPLTVKYEARPIWAAIEQTFEVGPTGAAIVIAAFEAFFAGRAVSYSRNNNWYCSTRHPLLTRRKVIDAVDHLDAAGWIIHHRQPPGARGWQSSFEATEKLLDAIEDILSHKPKLRLARLQSTTILRDENGASINFRQTREIARQDRKTEGFNEAIGASLIEHAEGPSIVGLTGFVAPMARIYNGSFMRGGRFYPMGTSWQNIKAEARRQLTIDGEPVVELDFDGMHIAMLYAEAGLPLPDDCHTIEGWPRHLVKVANFTLINAKTEREARFSIAHSDGRKIDKATGQRIEGPDDKQLMQSLAEPGSQEAISLAAELINAIKIRHAPIAQHLHSDAGARLMRKDADIAEAVMAELVLKKGIVTLPVHDSFLVQVSKVAELEAAMAEASYRIMGQYLAVSKAKAK